MNKITRKLELERGEAERRGGSLSFERLSEEKEKQIRERKENGFGSLSHRLERDNN